MSNCPICSKSIPNANHICPYCKNDISKIKNISAKNDKVKFEKIKTAYSLLFSENITTDSVNDSINNLISITNDTHLNEEVRSLLDAANWALILLRTGVAFKETNYDSDKNILAFSNERNFYNDERLELLERFGDNRSLSERILKTVDNIRDSIFGTAVRAESLIAGCTDFNNKKLRRSCIDALKEYIDEFNEDEIVVFISAPTLNSKNVLSNEYLVAQKLKEQLEFLGVKAFWWETFNSPNSKYVWDRRRDDLSISAKIAFGLAISSVFISLAFDEENYIKSANCMYELDKFVSFTDKKITPFIFKGKQDSTQITICQTGKADVVVDNSDSNFNALKQILETFERKLPEKRKQYYRFFNSNGLATFKKAEVDLYNTIYDNNDNAYVPIKVKNKNKDLLINAYLAKILEEVYELLNTNLYRHKYNEIKRRFHFSDEIEFKSWFCNPDKDVTISKEDDVVAYAKRHRTLNFCDVQNTPSNYHMAYAIIDSEGRLVNDNFLIFMENRGYKDDMHSLDIVLNLVIKDTNHYYSEVASIQELHQVLVGTYDERKGDYYYNHKKYSNIKIITKQTEKELVAGDLRYYTNQGGKLTFAHNSNEIDSVCNYGCKIILYNSEESKCEFELFMYAEYKNADWGKKIDKKRLFSKSSRFLRCPYCGHMLKYDRKTETFGAETVNFTYGGKEGTTVYTHELNESGHIICKSNNSHNTSLKTRELPQSYQNKNDLNKYNRSAVILMLGLAESGKSVFVSKLFDVWYTNDEYEVAIGDERVNTKGVSFTGKEIQVNFAEPKLQYLKSALSRYFEISYPQQADNRDLSDYCSIPYYKFMSKTMSEALDPNYLPSMLLELKRENSRTVDTLSLIDIPGEALKDAISVLNEDNSEDRRYEKQCDRIFNIFHNCDAMIFMLDLDNQSNITNLVKIMQNINKKSNVALAIAVCKCDKYEEVLKRNYASINSFIPNEDSKFYAGSDRDKYINFASDKIKEFIKDYCIKNYGEESYTKLAEAITRVPFHKFFAVSAIGNKESIFVDERRKADDAYRCSTRFIATPRGIDNVILWLTYQLGIID